MDLNYFGNNPNQKQETPAFSMDFGNLGGFDMKFTQPAPTSIKPIIKPPVTISTPIQNFSFQPATIMPSVPSASTPDPNNPFA